MNPSDISFFELSVFGPEIVGGCDKVSAALDVTAGQKLDIVAPADQSVRQGDQTKFTLSIVRQNCDDAVEIEITGLPQGVTLAPDSDLTIDRGMLKSRCITFIADKDAPIVGDQFITVGIRGPLGISAQDLLKLDVRPGP